MRVMIVDDHPMWRDAVGRDLTEAGFEVVVVSSPRTPISACSYSPLAASIATCWMPSKRARPATS